eukprot:3470940-Amphidinium_carterae.1
MHYVTVAGLRAQVLKTATTRLMLRQPSGPPLQTARRSTETRPGSLTGKPLATLVGHHGQPEVAEAKEAKARASELAISNLLSMKPQKQQEDDAAKRYMAVKIMPARGQMRV